MALIKIEVVFSISQLEKRLLVLSSTLSKSNWHAIYPLYAVESVGKRVGRFVGELEGEALGELLGELLGEVEGE